MTHSRVAILFIHRALLMDKLQRQHLSEIETAADEILVQRREIVNLDKKRQKTREAIRAVESNKSCKKTWVWNGSLFLRVSSETAEKSLKQDFKRFEEEINNLREDLKLKVNKLNDLQHKGALKGFNLTPLSQEELRKVTAELD